MGLLPDFDPETGLPLRSRWSLEDFARSFGSGLVHGGSMLLGLPVVLSTWAQTRFPNEKTGDPAAAGSATINVRNITAGSLSEAVVIKFALIKGVNA